MAGYRFRVVRPNLSSRQAYIKGEALSFVACGAIWNSDVPYTTWTIKHVPGIFRTAEDKVVLRKEHAATRRDKDLCAQSRCLRVDS